MRHVYIARHGETEWNREGRWQGHTDVPLSEVGRAQASALGRTVASWGITAVHASDLSRARETAEIVARAVGVAQVVVDTGLRERGFGCFEGLTREECQARYPDDWAAYRGDVMRTPPGAEPHTEVIARMRAAVLRAAAGAPADARLVVVSHGGAIRALVGSITGVVPPPLSNGAVFHIEADGVAFGAVQRLV